MKRILFCLILLTTILVPVISQSTEPDITKVSDGLNTFSLELINVVPNLAVQQGVWADAYIGKLIPSVPPHLGGGLTLGIAQLNSDGLNDSIDELNKLAGKVSSLSGTEKGKEIPSLPENLVLPTITADLRIGGIFLPFDLGVSVMKIPTVSINAMGAGTQIDFFTVGTSLRVPLYEGNIILPKISLGAGFMYSKGSIGAYIDDDKAFVSTDFDTKTMFLEAQVSKKLLIFTPFIGARGILSESTNNWAWKYNISFAGYTVGTEESGSVSRSLSDSFKDNFQYQVYGGLSIDILIVQTTVSASYDFKNNIWGGNLSLRAKL